MIGHVSDLLTNISSSLKLIVYPPAQGPTVHGKTEYTLDMSLNGLTDKPNVIWEMGDWDFREEPYVALRAWARQASNAGAPYFFTLQQSIKRSGFQARRDRIEGFGITRKLTKKIWLAVFQGIGAEIGSSDNGDGKTGDRGFSVSGTAPRSLDVLSYPP